MDKYFNILIEEVKGTDKNLRILFSKTFKFLRDLIKKELQEEKSISVTFPHELSLPKKRALLKKIYTQVLKKMGQSDNIGVFMRMIDTVPEDYLDYELQINTEQAGKFVDDLIRGKGEIANNELGNLVNIVKGVGIPAIANYVTGDDKLSKETASFGAEAINKNVKDYIDSKESRYSDKGKLSPPTKSASKEIVNTTQEKSIAQIKKELMLVLDGALYNKIKRTPLGDIVSQVKGSKVDLSKRLPDLAHIIKNSKNYKQANELFKDKAMGIEFQTQNEFEQFLNSLHSAKKEKVEAPKEKVTKKREKTYD